MVIRRGPGDVFAECNSWGEVLSALRGFTTLRLVEVFAATNKARDNFIDNDVEAKHACFDILFHHLSRTAAFLTTPDTPCTSTTALSVGGRIVADFSLANTRHDDMLLVNLLRNGYFRLGYGLADAQTLRRVAAASLAVVGAEGTQNAEVKTAASQILYGTVEVLSSLKHLALKMKETQKLRSLRKMTAPDMMRLVVVLHRYSKMLKKDILPGSLLNDLVFSFDRFDTKMKAEYVRLLGQKARLNKVDNPATTQHCFRLLKRIARSVAMCVLSHFHEASIITTAWSYSLCDNGTVRTALVKYIVLTKLTTFSSEGILNLLRVVPYLSAVQDTALRSTLLDTAHTLLTNLPHSTEQARLSLKVAHLNGKTELDSTPLDRLYTAPIDANTTVALVTAILAGPKALRFDASHFLLILEKSEVDGMVLTLLCKLFGRISEYPEHRVACLEGVKRIDAILTNSNKNSTDRLKELNINVFGLRMLMRGMHEVMYNHLTEPPSVTKRIRNKVVQHKWRPRFDFGQVEISALCEGLSLEDAVEHCEGILGALSLTGTTHHGAYFKVVDFILGAEFEVVPIRSLVFILGQQYEATAKCERGFFIAHNGNWNGANIQRLVRFVHFALCRVDITHKARLHHVACFPILFKVLVGIGEGEDERQFISPVFATLFKQMAAVDFVPLFSAADACVVVKAFAMSKIFPKSTVASEWDWVKDVDAKPTVLHSVFSGLETVILTKGVHRGTTLNAAVLACKEMQLLGYGGRHGLLLKLACIYIEKSARFAEKEELILLDTLKIAGFPQTTLLRERAAVLEPLHPNSFGVAHFARNS